MKILLACRHAGQRARAPVSAKAPKSVTAGGSGVSKQGQRSFQITACGPAWRPARKGSRTCANHCLLAGPRRQCRGTRACWRARASVSAKAPKCVTAGGLGVSKQRQRSFQITACVPAWRPASKGSRTCPNHGLWPVRAASERRNPSLRAGPGAKERKGAQICDCWRAQAQAKAKIFLNLSACGPAWRLASTGSRTCPNRGP